jgi:hypothetical protein
MNQGFDTFRSPAAAGAPTLALGAQVANNDMNSELCWTAMVWFIF